MDRFKSEPSTPAVLKDEVLRVYSEAATSPEASHPFPVGRDFALEVGYSDELLTQMPEAAVASFTGLCALSVLADIREGQAVLDMGCGAGLDTLVALQKVGPGGRVHGLDFSPKMIERAKEAAAEAGAGNIEFICADAEDIPLPDNSVDVVLVNGLLNLNPAREKVLAGILRTLKKPSGVAYISEIILMDDEGKGKDAAQCSIKDWFR